MFTPQNVRLDYITLLTYNANKALSESITRKNQLLLCHDLRAIFQWIVILFSIQRPWNCYNLPFPPFCSFGGRCIVSLALAGKGELILAQYGWIIPLLSSQTRVGRDYYMAYNSRIGCELFIVSGNQFEIGFGIIYVELINVDFTNCLRARFAT